MKYRIVVWHHWGESVCREWYTSPEAAELSLLRHGLCGWVQRFRDGQTKVDSMYRSGDFA